MKRTDTTDPRAHQRRVSLLEEAVSNQAQTAINRFRIHLSGMYYSPLGPEWDSQGKEQTDSLHHIEIPLSGHRQVIHKEHTVDITPGHAYFMPGNTLVERRHIESGQALWITFWCEWLPGVDPLMHWPKRVPMALGDCDLSYWKKWLQPEWQSSANHLLQLRAQIQSWLAEALLSLDTIIAKHLSDYAPFEPVFQLVEDKLGADLRITDLAKAHGTTTQAFSQSFTTATNTTPKQYLNRRLNQAAIQLVIGTHLSMKEIAFHLAFADEFYFSRFFKKLNGIAPTAYRKRFRGK